MNLQKNVTTKKTSLYMYLTIDNVTFNINDVLLRFSAHCLTQ